MTEHNPVILLHYDSGDGVVKDSSLPGDMTWPELFDEFRQFLLCVGFIIKPGEFIEEGEPDDLKQEDEDLELDLDDRKWTLDDEWREDVDAP